MPTTSSHSWPQRVLLRLRPAARDSCKSDKYDVHLDHDRKRKKAPLFSISNNHNKSNTNVNHNSTNPLKPFKTPNLDLSQVTATNQGLSPDSPESPPPPENCDEREVRRILLKLPGKPKRVKNLFIALLSAGPQATALLDKVAHAIAEDDAVLRAAVALVTGTDSESTSPALSPPRAPVAVAGPPRERLRLPWAVSNFILAGPPVLKAAVVASKACLEDLAQVFMRINYDPARASFAAAIIVAAIIENPRTAANVVANNRELIKALVAHIDSAPAMDVLTRLVGTRDLSLRDPGAVVPAHKKSIASLYKFKVYKMLADKFESAASPTTTNHLLKPASQIACSHITHLLAEMQARALVIPKKLEDPDERYDGFGIAHLDITPPSVYNDALDYLCLLVNSDSPLFRILDIALVHNNNNNNSNRDHVLVCALELTAKALNCLANARKSSMPLVNAAAKGRKTAKFQKHFVHTILPSILNNNIITSHNTSSRVRTACVDTLCALIDIAHHDILKEIIVRHKIMDTLFDVIGKPNNANNNNMNTLRVAKTVENAFSERKEVPLKWTLLLEHSSLLDYLEALLEEEKGCVDNNNNNNCNINNNIYFRNCMEQLAELVCAEYDGSLDTVSDGRRQAVVRIGEKYHAKKKPGGNNNMGLLKEDDNKKEASNNSALEKLGLNNIDIQPTEDKGIILYARSLTRGIKDNNNNHNILEAVFSRRSGG